MAYFDCREVITTGNSTQWPKDDQPEVLLVGRSNTGKSSLINTLTNRKNLAYVGKTPGKTRLLNFYEMTTGFRLVDSPGYGYAENDRKRLNDFSTLMEDYLDLRKNCKGILLLVDSRREMREDEDLIIELAKHYKLPFLIVLTKIDKLNLNQAKMIPAKISKQTGISAGRIILTSSATKFGIENLISRITSLVNN